MFLMQHDSLRLYFKHHVYVPSLDLQAPFILVYSFLSTTVFQKVLVQHSERKLCKFISGLGLLLQHNWLLIQITCIAAYQWAWWKEAG